MHWPWVCRGWALGFPWESFAESDDQRIDGGGGLRPFCVFAGWSICRNGRGDRRLGSFLFEGSEVLKNCRGIAGSLMRIEESYGEKLEVMGRVFISCRHFGAMERFSSNDAPGVVGRLCL